MPTTSTQKILTASEAAALAANLSKLSLAEKVEALELLEKSQEHKKRNLARTDMIEFAKHVYPGFKVGPHHRKLARIFTDVIEGRDRKSTRLNSSHTDISRMPSSA